MGVAAAVVLVLVIAGIFWIDAPLYLFLRRFDCKLWTYVAYVFEAKVWLLSSAVLVAAFYVKKAIALRPVFRNARGKISPVAFVTDGLRRVRGSYAFHVFCAVFMASLVALGLKFIIGRGRPIFFEALDLSVFFVPFSTEWAFHSMPSGHAVATFAGLVMLGMLAPKIKPFTWTLAVVVGVSRVCVGAHWPSDVLLGAFIGMVAADIVKWFLKSRQVQK